MPDKFDASTLGLTLAALSFSPWIFGLTTPRLRRMAIGGIALAVLALVVALRQPWPAGAALYLVFALYSLAFAIVAVRSRWWLRRKKGYEGPRG
jgi:hypothetical protein